ncbi:MAG: TlpA family protein disulfide reductase [Thiobacillus sp.]|nr:TlpA family protein disulfide reductase [Thiobacillus sp.]
MKRWMAMLIAVGFAAGGAGAAGLEIRPAQPAPELRAPDLAGANKTLADYNGKVVLLNFWATWCPPCRREMPSLERLREKMAGRPLEIVAIDSAEPLEDVRGFLATLKLEFTVLLDPEGENTRRWKVYALPTSFLLDSGGRIRYVLKGGAEWDEGEFLRAVESLLAEAEKSPGR